MSEPEESHSNLLNLISSKTATRESSISASGTLRSCATGAAGLVAFLLFRRFFIDLKGLAVKAAGRIAMGQSATKKSESREGVKRISDSVYELYAPPGVPEVEIVFFHGLQPFEYRDAHRKTWLTEGPESEELWPQTWLPREFEKARILTVSYDSSAHKGSTAGQTDMYLIGESLMQSIILSPQVHVGQSPNCPVIFVGHSLGGFVIKKVILFAKFKLDQLSQNRAQNERDVRRLESFLGNIKGVFYFATPHNGSDMANVKQMTDLLKIVPQNSEVLKFLTVLNKDACRLNDEFRVWRQNNNVRAWTLFELLPTTLWPGFRRVVVEEGSARFDSDKLMGVNADHVSICKLKDPVSDSYQFLTNFIAECKGSELEMTHRHRQEEEALMI